MQWKPNTIYKSLVGTVIKFKSDGITSTIIECKSTWYKIGAEYKEPYWNREAFEEVCKVTPKKSYLPEWL